MGENGSISDAERRFAREMRAGRNLYDNPPTEQEASFLLKWDANGWWDYGMSQRHAVRLTEKGWERLRKQRASEN